MVDTDQGLTQADNKLKDPTCSDAPIAALRTLHIEMDRAVLAAYGWDDIQVPPYTASVTPDEQRALETFQDEVIDRLFLLNAERAKEEQLAGKSAKKGKGTKKRGGKRKPQNSAQLGLLDE